MCIQVGNLSPDRLLIHHIYLLPVQPLHFHLGGASGDSLTLLTYTGLSMGGVRAKRGGITRGRGRGSGGCGRGYYRGVEVEAAGVVVGVLPGGRGGGSGGCGRVYYRGVEVEAAGVVVGGITGG